MRVVLMVCYSPSTLPISQARDKYKTDRSYICFMSKSAATRQFIIEKASQVLNRKGMAGTSISDIMEATKLAKGGIYGNFENKDEICLEAFNFLTEKQRNNLNRAILAVETPADKLRAIADFYTTKARLDDNGGCPILNFGTEADDTNPTINHRVAEAIKISQSRISNLIKEGIETGQFRESVNPEEFAIKMFSLMEGAILVSRILETDHQMMAVRNILYSEIEALKK